jgi:hypothetical protein
MHFPAPTLHIRRLRASVPDGDGPAMRRRWERAFATADAVPVELGKEGVLVLRRVRWQAGPRGLSQLRPWLVAARQRAARPAIGAVPAGAEAVWFASEAELLACIARDAQSGALAGGWWWRALGLAADAASVARRWSEAPRAVPAALETLAREGRAGEFLATLAPAHCRRLAAAVADAFALPALRTLADTADDLPAVSAPMPRRLQELIPEPPPRLPPPALALWACCILLVRHPSTARTNAVQELLSQWLKPASGRRLERETASEEPIPSEAAAETEAPQRAVPLTPTPRPMTGEPPSVPRPSVEHADQPPASVAVDEEQKPALPSSFTVLPASVGRSENGGEITQSALEPPAPIQRSRETETQAATLQVRTAFGGVFYLLNVALDLGIYSDFTRPRGPNLALSPFDWLALLGRQWFADELEADPLWPLLAVLAGRAPTEPPGLPEGIADPEAWLVREAERVHQRLVAGLPELHLAVGGGARASSPLCGFGTPEGVSDNTCPEDPHGQAGRRPARRPRLQPTTGRRTALPDCVCRQDAEVCVNQQRVEVRFALATHPLELRLSGLDRDPGWLPAAGRETAFHYD